MIAFFDGALDEITFRMMGGLFGWSDQTWSLAVQVCGLNIAFLIGMKSQRNVGLFGTIAVGLAANVIGQFYIAGGGPGFVLGIVILPIYCMAGYFLGRGVRRWVMGRPAVT